MQLVEWMNRYEERHCVCEVCVQRTGGDRGRRVKGEGRVLEQTEGTVGGPARCE